jgi:hypothetical protein
MTTSLSLVTPARCRLLTPFAVQATRGTCSTSWSRGFSRSGSRRRAPSTPSRCRPILPRFCSLPHRYPCAFLVCSTRPARAPSYRRRTTGLSSFCLVSNTSRANTHSFWVVGGFEAGREFVLRRAGPHVQHQPRRHHQGRRRLQALGARPLHLPGHQGQTIIIYYSIHKIIFIK